MPKTRSVPELSRCESDHRDRDRVGERVAASRAAQGLPPTITDPAILQAVVDVFRAVDVSSDADRAVPTAKRARRTRRHAG